jgi:hypothetical protein
MSLDGSKDPMFIYCQVLWMSVTARNGNDDLFLALSRFCFLQI